MELMEVMLQDGLVLLGNHIHLFYVPHIVIILFF
jgi:hypothetical protein